MILRHRLFIGNRAQIANLPDELVFKLIRIKPKPLAQYGVLAVFKQNLLS